MLLLILAGVVVGGLLFMLGLLWSSGFLLALSFALLTLSIVVGAERAIALGERTAPSAPGADPQAQGEHYSHH